VTDPASPDKLHDAIGSAFGSPQLDIMVHNAGITRDKTFGKMKEEGFHSVIDVNLGSIIRLDKMLLSRSKGVMQDGSRLVYLSSIAGERMEATLLSVSAIYVTHAFVLLCVCQQA
jgi:3-oxoacyl-[acyl-carrier protein] reductase